MFQYNKNVAVILDQKSTFTFWVVSCIGTHKGQYHNYLFFIFLFVRHEVVGEVVEVGSNVSKFRVGERVGVGIIVGSCQNCRSCEAEIEQYCNKKIWTYNDVYTDGNPTQGGFASAMVVDQK